MTNLSDRDSAVIRAEEAVAAARSLLTRAEANLSRLTAKPKPEIDTSLQREIDCSGCNKPIAVGAPVAYLLVTEGFERGVGEMKMKLPVCVDDSCLQAVAEKRPVGLASEIIKSWSNPEFRNPAPCKNCGRVMVIESRGKPNKYCDRRCKQQFENRSRKLA